MLAKKDFCGEIFYQFLQKSDKHSYWFWDRETEVAST